MARAIIHLKGPWAQNGTERDECATYFLDKDAGKLTCYDREDCRGRVWWYPIENIARVEVSHG